MKFVAFLLFSICVIIIFSSCPNGTVEFQNHCYFFETNATNFPNAELACNSLNGHLVSIHDGFTNAIITGQSGNYFHDSTTVDFWIGLNSLINPGNWSWTDNSSLGFHEWAPTEPKNLTMNCGALTVKSGLWASDDCFKTKPYVCETTTTPVSTTPFYPAYMNCTEGWVYFEPTHSCYGHNGYSYQYGNWTAAEQYCESVNAHLPSIHSYDEARFLSTMVALITNVGLWTGLYSNDNEVTWKWSDGSPVDYLPWGSGYPNRNVSSCAYLHINQIYDDTCTASWYIICKKPATL
uniref:C-type lectin domain-containing protein n=1 Tax=Panagrolaimus davidi TaxID=227884 RepID=A0A914PV11_9BILA